MVCLRPIPNSESILLWAPIRQQRLPSPSERRSGHVVLHLKLMTEERLEVRPHIEGQPTARIAYSRTGRRRTVSALRHPGVLGDLCRRKRRSSFSISVHGLARQVRLGCSDRPSFKMQPIERCWVIGVEKERSRVQSARRRIGMIGGQDRGLRWGTLNVVFWS